MSSLDQAYIVCFIQQKIISRWNAFEYSNVYYL